jgi:DNA (cytosine-5)-methyltransferase 1
MALCAGIGGLELGVRLAARARTICYVERDAFAASVLVARMADQALDRAPVADDLRSFDGRAWRGVVDLVTTGYPCQPFSVAGKRRGESDERHLWPEVRRIIDECGVPLAFLENVRGHLTLGFSEVLGDLAELGFDAEWGVFSAAEVGAPHKRERLFVLAYRDGGRRCLDRCTRLLDGERQALGDDADGCDAGVADSDDFGPERNWPARNGWLRSSDECRSIWHADEPRTDALPASGGSRQAVGEPSCDLADAQGERLGSRSWLDQTVDGLGPIEASARPWPPGPSDEEGWRTYRGPVPVLRRGVDGPSAFVDRADRLRCLGNGVVPLQAAFAFTTLARRIVRRRP